MRQVVEYDSAGKRFVGLKIRVSAEGVACDIFRFCLAGAFRAFDKRLDSALLSVVLHVFVENAQIPRMNVVKRMFLILQETTTNSFLRCLVVSKLIC